MASCVAMISAVLFLLALIQTPAAALQQQTGVVTGVVRTNSGQPLEGMRVAVTPANAGVVEDVLESIAQTDKDGRFRLESISPGRYYLVAGRSASLTYYPGVPDRNTATVFAVTAGNTITVPDMVFSRTHLTGRVVDISTGQGRPVQTLTLCCEFSDVRPLGGTLALLMSAKEFKTAVRSDGSFEFSDLPAGFYALRASDPGIIAMGQAIRVSGDEMSGVEVKVSPGVSVSGVIVDNGGKPALGMYLRLRPLLSNSAFAVSPPLPAPSPGMETVMRAVPPASFEELRASLAKELKYEFRQIDGGDFSIKRVFPGRYLLEVLGNNTSVEREIEVPPQGLDGIRFEIPVIQLTGRVVTPNNEPLPKIEGSIRVIPSAPNAQIMYAFPNSEGRFPLILPAGEYRISTENLGFRVRSVTDGLKDLTEPFVYDGVSRMEITVTLE